MATPWIELQAWECTCAGGEALVGAGPDVFSADGLVAGVLGAHERGNSDGLRPRCDGGEVGVEGGVVQHCHDGEAPRPPPLRQEV